MARPLTIPHDLAHQDPEGNTWLFWRRPRRSIDVHWSQVPHLPLDQCRLVGLSKAQLVQIDPCPPDWRTARLDQLLSNAQFL